MFVNIIKYDNALLVYCFSILHEKYDFAKVSKNLLL